MVVWIVANVAGAAEVGRYVCSGPSDPTNHACECLSRKPYDPWWLGSARLYTPFPLESCFRDSFVEVGWVGSAWDYDRAKRQIDAMRTAYARLLEAAPGPESLVSQYESEQIHPTDWLGFLRLADDRYVLTDSWGNDIAWLDFPGVTLRNVHQVDLDEDKVPDLVFGLDEEVWWVQGPVQQGETLFPPKLP